LIQHYPQQLSRQKSTPSFCILRYHNQKRLTRATAQSSSSHLGKFLHQGEFTYAVASGVWVERINRYRPRNCLSWSRFNIGHMLGALFLLTMP